ncbi:MAG: hypothetical protein A2X28_11125 [Elusimicrobia bacterium GWA2_56_46]|nr:MAG: hypothetical protein A2X28_11125 [Elusimicrobia bacterium GWA2_56_46]OGR54151.1 MAG: hypothetical protein A2X39_05500 [Elusimicrobia bacterium GWC2_56_31]HBB68103.1 hypothetical protein [Elusimicrobiota bacterium]HBW23867.1 hypothetical protein [Elusimicrobiota bacterium]
MSLSRIKTWQLLLTSLLCCAFPASADNWTLASYKAEVFRVSHEIKKTAEDAEIYKGRYVSELARFYLPSVIISASDTPYSAHNDPRLRFNRDDTAAGVAASFNLYNNFKDKLSLDSSRLSSKVYERRLWLERQRVTLAALGDYYGVLRKKRLLEVVRNSLDSYRQQYEKITRYYNEGMKSYSDVLKSELGFRSSQLSEVGSLEDYRNAVMDFNLSLYRAPETGVELEDFVSYSTASFSAAEGDVDYALSRRPELEILTLERRMAAYSAKKALIERFPGLSIDAYYDRQGLGSWGRPAAGSVNPDYSLKLSLSLPLGPATFSERQSSFEADTALERADREIYLRELQVRREVVSARLALATAVKRYEVSGLKAGISKQNLEIVNSRYNEGRSGIIELTGAQSDDLSAQSELANAFYDLLLAGARYDAALGRQLW